MDIFLVKLMYFKEMEHAHHRISTLAHVNRLVDEVVDWCDMVSQHTPKMAYFPGVRKCGDQDKSNIMVGYLLWHVLTGIHNITLSIMIAGHTKFWCFGLLKEEVR